MEDRKRFWELNKHLLLKEKINTTILTYSKKTESDSIFTDVPIIVPDNIDLLKTLPDQVPAKFYLFSNSLIEVVSETLNVTRDFICFYKVSNIDINDQLNNGLETEESDLSLRSNLYHGYKDCPEKVHQINFVKDTEVKILQTKDLVWHFNCDGKKIKERKELIFYGINYPAYDIGTCNGSDIYVDKKNVVELVQFLDYMFKLCTEKGKSTLIIGEIFRNCPLNLVVYYLRSLSKKYMFVNKVFICYQKTYNTGQYNILKKVETQR